MAAPSSASSPLATEDADASVPPASENARSECASNDAGCERTGVDAWGKQIGEAFGAGESGLAGVGENGGGRGVGFGSAPSEAGPSVRLGTIHVDGGLPPEVIHRIVRQRLSDFRTCYQTALQNTPTKSGRMTMHFVVGSRGIVTRARLLQTTLSDVAMEKCILRHVVGLKFPKPEGGADVTVDYPLAFSH